MTNASNRKEIKIKLRKGNLDFAVIDIMVRELPDEIWHVLHVGTLNLECFEQLKEFLGYDKTYKSFDTDVYEKVLSL